MLEPSVCCAFPELRSGDEIFTKHCLYLSINMNLPVAVQSRVAVRVIKGQCRYRDGDGDCVRRANQYRFGETRCGETSLLSAACGLN